MISSNRRKSLNVCVNEKFCIRLKYGYMFCSLLIRMLIILIRVSKVTAIVELKENSNTKTKLLTKSSLV